MALSQPRTLFGIHEIVMYQRTTGIPYGSLRVLGGSTLTVTGEIVQLLGGSSKFPWDAQDGNISAEISIKPKEIPPFLFQVLLGVSPTETLNDPGNVADFANVFGTSVLEATTGIASVGVTSGDEADLKFGKYVIKANDQGNEIDVYALSSVDFLTGTDLEYLDDSLKINSAAIVIPDTGGTIVIAELGIEFTGGSGTVALVENDTATFDINPPSTEEMYAKVGEFGACIPEFGAIVTAQKKGDGSMWLFDCYRVKALGFPFGMEEKAYNEAELTGTLLYDSLKNGVFQARYIKPVAGCN